MAFSCNVPLFLFFITLSLPPSFSPFSSPLLLPHSLPFSLTCACSLTHLRTHSLSLLSCVAENQRTLALGVQSFFWRLFGSIPGPILFRVIFDSACLFWQQECNRRGNCWVYDNTALSRRAVVLAILAMAGYFISMFLCWWVYPRSSNGDTTNSGKEDKKKDGAKLNGDILQNGETETSEGGGSHDGEGGREGGGGRERESDELMHISVISQMQSRNSMAELLETDEVGINRKSLSLSSGTDM